MRQVIHLQISSATEKLIEKYQHNRHIPTKAEAARRLLNKAIDVEVPENEYQDMRIRAETTKQYFLPIWTENMFENYQMFKREDRKQDMCLSTLVGKHKDEPCICTASGPSLDADIEYLKKWKGIIISGPTQCSTLKAHGIEPHYVCAYDAGKAVKKFIDWQEDYSKVTLIANMQMNHRFLSGWPGPKKYYLNVSAAEDYNLEASPMSVMEFLQKYKVPVDDPISRYLRDEYTILTRFTTYRAFTFNRFLKHGIRMHIHSVGSTGNNELMVASVLGCKPIGMAGHDLGLREGGNLKFTKWLWDRKQGKYVEHPSNFVCTRENNYGMKRQRHIRRSDNGMITSEEMIGYKMSSIITSFHKDNQFFELAHNNEFGILDYYPKIEIAEFVERQGKGYEHLYLDNAERFHKANDYYVSHGQGKLMRPVWLREDGTVDETLVNLKFDYQMSRMAGGMKKER